MIRNKSICENLTEAEAFVKECEADYEKRINEIAENIAGANNLRCVTLCGPSCSGKTTTAQKLTYYLHKYGKIARVVSIDDFFYGEEEMKNLGIDDFEGPDAVNLSLFRRAVSDLSKGIPTLMPTFDFTTRSRECFTEYKPGDKDIYIFEGIQAVYPSLSAILKNFNYKSIFISVAEGIAIGDTEFSKGEVRLIRRIVRDNFHRSTPPEKTMLLWENVRKNEEVNIFPNVGGESYVINSTIGYEVLLMSKYFIKVTENYPRDAFGAYTVYSIRDRLSGLLTTAVSLDIVPEISVMREFAN